MTSRGLAFWTLLLLVLPAASVFSQQPADPSATPAEPAATTQAFQMTTLRTSQPQVFAVLADRALGAALKNAVLPALFGQDTSYSASRSSRGFQRAADAAAHSLVVRNSTGGLRLNAAEVGGAAIAAGLSNVYRPAADRSVTATLSRWGTQLLFDTLSNEVREFWPDIRRVFRKS